MNNYGTLEIKDILTKKKYASLRKNKRQEIMAVKKKRRVFVGPYITFYFENKKTILHQINEMVFIEDGGLNQIREELNAYGSLVPNGSELVITLMIEIDNPVKREISLRELGGIENKTFIKMNDLIINGIAERDLNRTKEDGKSSSVHFIHFPFDKNLFIKFIDKKNRVHVGVDHVNYSHFCKLTNEVRIELRNDFSYKV